MAVSGDERRVRMARYKELSAGAGRATRAGEDEALDAILAGALELRNRARQQGLGMLVYLLELVLLEASDRKRDRRPPETSR